MPQRQLDRLGIRLVAQAVVAKRQPRRIELVRDAVEDQRRARRDRQAVQQLEGLLNLERRHHRGDRRRRRHLAREDLVARQQRAAIAEVQELVVALRSWRTRSTPSRAGRRP